MYVPTSCILFHGPGAETEGLSSAQTFGRLLPFTGSALKKDGARELVGLLSNRPVGDQRVSVLVGPVDEITTATSDVLLKVIEEFDPEGVRPFLWAWDLGGVALTLRSRCVLRFCGGVDTRTEAYSTLALSALKAYQEGDWVTLTEELKAQESLDLFLRAMADLLAPKLTVQNPNPLYLHLWESLRPLLGRSTLTLARVISAFLLASHRNSGGL